MAAVVSCIMCLLAACGGQAELAKSGSESRKEESAQKDAQTVDSAEEPGRTVGICIYRKNDDFMKLYCRELKSYLETQYDISDEDIQVFYARESQEEQNRQIEKLTELPVDVLIVNAVEETAIPAITDRCREREIPVVYISRKPSEEEMDRWDQENLQASWVGAEGKQSGILQGEIILETKNHGDINGDGIVSYVMITGTDGVSDAEERTKYAIETLEKGGMKTRNMFQASGNWDQEEGKRQAKEALGKYGRQIEVIFCNNDAMANGAREAALESRRLIGRDLYIAGVDALEETVSYIKEGTMTGTVLNDYYGQAHLAADVAMKMADGEKTEKQYLVDYIKVAK